MFDINAPIIPFVEMGSIKLYSIIDELTPMLNSSKANSIKLNDNWIRYDIDNIVGIVQRVTGTISLTSNFAKIVS